MSYEHHSGSSQKEYPEEVMLLIRRLLNLSNLDQEVNAKHLALDLLKQLDQDREAFSR